MLVPDIEKKLLEIEIGMLRSAFRINFLRHGYSGTEIDEMLDNINRRAKGTLENDFE
jgi:hypothetical protein